MDSANTHGSLRTANAARQKEWDRGDVITAASRGNELAGEVGEACNIIKKLERERLGIKGSRATVEMLAEELADIIICVDLIAMGYGIDVEEAVAAKFNKTSDANGLATRLLPASQRDRRLAAFVEALTPSNETKAAYIGEFSIRFPEVDEDGLECMRDINVPWTTTKEIMAAIRARAEARAAAPEGEK